MDDTAKYLIHADFTASGVVERSDVVGAVFGQTEGLLGNDLDLRDLQQSSKVGRIDVEVESQEGRSFGRITIASSLDRVETAILAASLETISRVGPCRAQVAVQRIEDVRAAKRRQVVDRAKELLSTAFDESVMSSGEVLEEVRESVRVEDITSYEGLPAGPRVADSDAVILVEGRADVLTLLRYGVKNAVAVEGTDVPEAVSDLTAGRTVTAFLDGDRGGDLILRELGQVGDVDYVARAPAGASVEDLGRREVTEALRSKVAFADAPALGDDGGDGDDVPEDGRANDSATEDEAAGPDGSARAGTATSDGGLAVEGRPGGTGSAAASAAPMTAGGSAADGEAVGAEGGAAAAGAESAADGTVADADPSAAPAEEDAADDGSAGTATTLADHAAAVVGDGTARLLDDDWAVAETVDAGDAFEAVEAAAEPPAALVLDGTVTQRLLDVAAQRGVRRVVGTDRGSFTKQPAAVRVHTVAELSGE